MKAFSTVELLLALLIFSIMLLITINFGKWMLEKNRAEAYMGELRTALRFARISAIKLGEKVTFCGSKSHKKCDSLWQDGQIVITSSNRVLRVLPKIFAGDKLIWRGSFGKKDYIEFLPTGGPDGQLGHFYYCHKNSKESGLALFLTSTGRVRMSDKTEDGKKIICN